MNSGLFLQKGAVIILLVQIRFYVFQQIKRRLKAFQQPLQMKTKEQRVKEAINLLKKVQELPNEFGLFGQDAVYLQIKSAISSWVQTGVPNTLVAPMYRVGRNAELVLNDEQVASLALKILVANDLD